MTLTWVICGAGRGVGKTRLAQKLCEVLPDAVYAKQGHGEKRPEKPDNFFHTDEELAAFVAANRGRHEHIVVESNELAREGEGDFIIFVDGIPGLTDCRPDADLLRSKAHMHTGPDASTRDWGRVLKHRLRSDKLCAAVCEVLADQRSYASESSPAIRRVAPVRVSTEGGPAVRERGEVVVEELVTVMVEDVGSFTLMCTPCDVEALAIGFAFSEGMISSIDDVVDYTYRPEQQTIGMRIDDPQRATTARNLIVTSSCGLCGSRNIDKLMTGGVTSGDNLRVTPALLRKVVEDMHARQPLFRRTGGTHAAGVFNADAELIAVAEDIGRHNALDKSIGKCLMRGISVGGCGAALSGRISLELIAKAARAGLEILAAVSAPSSLAIQAAESCNITLCGFVRAERATVYTHPRRIVGLEGVKSET
jgi:FdhD protein